MRKYHFLANWGVIFSISCKPRTVLSNCTAGKRAHLTDNANFDYLAMPKRSLIWCHSIKKPDQREEPGGNTTFSLKYLLLCLRRSSLSSSSLSLPFYSSFGLLFFHFLDVLFPHCHCLCCSVTSLCFYKLFFLWLFYFVFKFTQFYFLSNSIGIVR